MVHAEAYVLGRAALLMCTILSEHVSVTARGCLASFACLALHIDIHCTTHCICTIRCNTFLWHYYFYNNDNETYFIWDITRSITRYTNMKFEPAQIICFKLKIFMTWFWKSSKRHFSHFTIHKAIFSSTFPVFT